MKPILPTLVFSFLICGSWTHAQESTPKQAEVTPETEIEKPVEVDPELEANFGTPRRAFENFILAMEKNDSAQAAKFLDLSELSTESVSAKAGPYAYKIKYILDVLKEQRNVNVGMIPDDVEISEPFYRIADCVYTKDLSPLTGQELADVRKILLTRGPDNLWRFSSGTIGAIDGIFENWDGRLKRQETKNKPQMFTAIWLRELFPENLRKKEDGDFLAGYQWICLIALIFIGAIADFIVRKLSFRLTHKWLKSAHQDESAERDVWKPVGLLVEALIWYLGTRILDLPDVAREVLLIGLKLFTSIAAVWTAFRLIDLLNRFLIRRASKTETGFDDLLAPMVSSSLKAVSVLIGLFIFAKAFDLKLTGLLAGLGLGGLVIALAAKDAISNIFGSFTILVDRPFEIGDWIVTEDIEGTVERVGFRSTRIRTFYNSLITLPNSRLTVAIVDNMGRRRYRRVRMILTIKQTALPEQIEAFCEGIRELIRRHPNSRKDYFHVYLNDFGDYSLNILLYCFFRCPDWSSELKAKHDLLLDIVKLAGELRIEFAYPTRDLNMFPQETAQVEVGSNWPDPHLEGQKAADRILVPGKN